MEEQHPEDVEQQQQPVLGNVEQQQHNHHQEEQQQQQHQEEQQQQQEQQPVLELVEQQQQQQPVLGNVEQQQHQEEEQQHQEEEHQQNQEEEHQQHQEEEQQQHQEEEQQQQQHHVLEILEEEEEINMGEAIRVMQAGCSNWIIEMEEILDNSRWSVVGKKPPSIYRVPDQIKRGNTEAYRPKLVSMGPLHYGEDDLVPMERHKKEAVLQRVKRFGKPLVEYVAAIQEIADELLDQYHNLDGKWRTQGREEFVQMMVLDGCFLLESIERYFDYPASNPVFSYHGCLTMYTAIRSDIILMENQLPLLVLHSILAIERDTAPSAADVNNMVLIFLGFSNWVDLDIYSLGQHPLDLLHQGVCGPKVDYVGIGWDNTMPSAAELSDAGIHFKVRETQFIHDISFRNGILSLPVFSAHDDTEKQILNLLAFEKLHPCTGHEVLSYISFMDNLVNTGRDVELLRSKGVIKNLLSSVEELAQQINLLGSGALMSPLSRLDDVQRMVSQHCKKPWNRWRASFAHSYLRNPWVFLSLLAAVILLIAAIIQTVYTVLSFYNKS